MLLAYSFSIVIRQSSHWFFLVSLLAGVAGCDKVSSNSTDAGDSCDPACSANGSCVEDVCACDPGFTGDGLVCEAFNCAAGNAGCDVNANCIDSVAGPTCECKAGYDGDGSSCVDIDECAVNNGDCDADARCFNTEGNRRCICDEGFVGNGATCIEIWELVGTLSSSVSGPITNVNAVGVRDDLIFSGTTESGPFLLSFDVVAQTFSNPPLNIPPEMIPEFIAGGLTEVFLSDDNSAFLIGDEANRYSPLTDTWTPVENFTFVFRRGEAAGTFVRAGNQSFFLLIGGRSNETTALRFQINGSIFSEEEGELPISMGSAVAHTLAGTTEVFVAGGDDNSGKGLVSHVFDSNIWERLPDAPDGLGRPAAMGEKNGQLWVAKRQGDFYFYDVNAQRWDTSPTSSPTGFMDATMVGDETYALFHVGSTIEVRRLNAF